MTAPDRVELKPCPFCGNEPASGGFSVACTVCPATVSGLSHDDVVRAWNRRATMTGANGQNVEIFQIGEQPIEVDVEIAPIVRALNGVGIRTRASCSGHGYRPANIVLCDGREIIIARDFAEARKIDALFPIDINGNAIATEAAELITELVEALEPFGLIADAIPAGVADKWVMEGAWKEGVFQAVRNADFRRAQSVLTKARASTGGDA